MIMARYKSGMSLVEVMVSMVILGLIVAAMYSTFSLMEKGTGTLSPLNTQAANYARETLEKLHNSVSADPTRAVPLNQGTDISDPLPDNDFKNKRGGTRKYTVADVDSNGDGAVDYKNVTVTVKWND